MAASGVYLPWAAGVAGEAPQESALALASSDLAISVVLGGRDGPRAVELRVPAELTCADLKGHLVVNGVLSTGDGFEVALEEAADSMDDKTKLKVEEGQTLYLRRAREMVSVTALVAGAEEEVFELVVPAEASGAELRQHIAETTAGALVVDAVFVAQDESEGQAVGDEEVVRLVDDQAILVTRSAAPAAIGDDKLRCLALAAAPATASVAEASAPSAVAAAPSASSSSAGLMGSLLSRFRGGRGARSQGEGSNGFRLRCASNVSLKGSTVSGTSKDPWAACAVFDVPDPNFFEVCVELLADAPKAEQEGFGGRWMLGAVPVVFAATKTERERRSLLNGGFFVTVCHGHPAKVRAPSMPTGTCGEDFAALPGELCAGQTLTLRYARGASLEEPGTLTVQMDDMDPVVLPYAPPPFEEVRPCLVFGGKPAAVKVLQLEPPKYPHRGGA